MPHHTWIETHRKNDTCAKCDEPINYGDSALYELGSHESSDGRTVYCEDCGKEIQAKT